MVDFVVKLHDSKWNYIDLSKKRRLSQNHFGIASFFVMRMYSVVCLKFLLKQI